MDTTNDQKLEAALKQQQELDDKLYHTFADAAKHFADWLKGERDALAKGHEKSLEDQFAEVKRLEGESKTAAEKIAVIKAADDHVKARLLANNPYTNTSLDDAQAQWQQFEILLQKKSELLQEQIAEKKRGGLTEAQIKEVNDNFTYFDKDKNGFLSKKEVRVCLQSLGEESTPQDVAKLFAEYDKAGAGHITLSEFHRMMKNNLGDTDTHDEIIKSFKYLSYDREVITAAELRNVVNDRSFVDAQVNYLTKEMPPKGESLDYAAWTKAVFER